MKKMKKLVMFIVITLSLGFQVMEAQTAKLKVGTNPTDLNSSAALEVQSTTQGFLPPRMGLSQITAIASPAEGLSVYCIDCFPKTVLSFDGINWVNANGLPPLIITPPAQATAVTATAGVGSASVAFTPPSYNSGGGVVSYTIISSPGSIQATGTMSPITINGLTAGTNYTFTVRATNVSGLTSTSAISNVVTPMASVPGSVTAVTATAGTGTTASVSFTAPTNTGGAAITGYTVTSSPGAITATGNTSPITISGLNIGSSYTFTVVATNSQGNSVASTASNSITIAATAPNAPTIGTATISGTTASVAFTAPANTGGATITGYTVTPTPATTPATFTGTTSPIPVTGLIAGTNYSFKVTATNSVGTSTASVASNFVQAADVPSAPSGLVATSVSGTSALVSFLAANSYGSSVTGYTLTPSPATTPATFTATSSPITVTGLTTGTNYTFSVTATNASGISAIGTVSFTPQNSVPSPPSGVVATAANASASILFTASTSNGGAAITGYTVTSTPGGITATGTTSPITVNGLTNGTAYTFTVVATNSVGNSEASSPSNSVKPVVVPVPVLTANNLTASAAYSLRKLSSSYNGAAVRVRRSSDNTEQDISFTASGNLDTAALTTFVGSGNGFVSVWYDQSGNGKNSSQTAQASQPRIVNAGVVDMSNGKPSIYFNGSANLSRTGMSISTDSNVAFTINTVFSTTQTGAGFWGQFDSTSNWTLAGLFNLYLAGSTAGQGGSFFGSSQYSGGYATGNVAANTGVSVIGTIAFPSSGNPSIFINGSQNTNNQNPTRSNSLGGASSIERIGGNSVQFNNLIGYISELHLFQSQLTATRASLELDQAAYYTISVSNVSATVSPPPPANTSALAVNAAATINFTQSTGANSYTVTSNPGGITATGSSSPIQISGLSNGTAYTFTVVATNSYGTSSPSAATNSVTPSVGAAGQTVPSAPEIGTATAGNTSASVAFKVPTNIGNSSITGYTVTSIPGGISATGTSSPITVSGLTVGSPYNFSVIATNSVGNSIASATSNAVTPFGVPAKPVIGTITPFGLAASVPVIVNTNGSAITSYVATVNPGNLIFNSATASISVVLPREGIYSVTVTATNAAGTSVSSAPVSFSVTAITSPQLSSNVSIADINGIYFSGINGITPTTVISVGGTCPNSVIWQGVTYPTVNIGGQCWTARNSKAMPTVSGLSFAYYLDAADETAAQEGLYYTWAAAMNGGTAERAQGVCPTGWHIPTTAEIDYLLLSTGLNVNNINTNIGSSIVGATNWMNSILKVGTFPGATNYTGFSNINGGFRSESNVFVGNFGLDSNSSLSTLWTSTQIDTNNAIRAVLTDYNNSLIASRTKLRSYSVRCLKD